jgi:hypothetical protein
MKSIAAMENRPTPFIGTKNEEEKRRVQEKTV